MSNYCVEAQARTMITRISTPTPDGPSSEESKKLCTAPTLAELTWGTEGSLNLRRRDLEEEEMEEEGHGGRIGKRTA